jgi:phosphoserine phosphatase RsbU/P
VIDTANRSGSSSSILLVDDDPAILRVLIRMLAKEQALEIATAESARAAREQLQRRRFDLVISDLAMPDEDGISLMQWANEHHPGMMWIVLTGHGTLQSAVRALQLGAFDFIAKPVNKTLLRSAVMSALERHHLRAERDRLHADLEGSNRRLRENIEELEEACTLLEEQSQLLQADLRRAALIQRALLPQSPPQTPGLTIHALYRLSQTVGGDLYDVVRLDRRHVVVLIADAAGHGLSAAMLAVLFRSRLAMVDADQHEPARPGHVLELANRTLLQGFTPQGLFLTAAYCLFDTVEAKVAIASAGHPPLIVQRRAGDLERLFHTGPALGLYADARFTEQELQLEPGDRLLLHTDGLYDRLCGDGASGGDQVIQFLRESALARRDPDDAHWLHALARLNGADGAPPHDDVTLLCVQASGGVSSFDNGEPPTIPLPTSPARDHGCEIVVGTDAQRLTLSVRGRATWMYSGALHDACLAAIDGEKDVTVDLTLCQHLDSTLLGTLHELATRAYDAKLEFRLQGVAPPVEALFAELGMERMLDHMVRITLPLPRQMTTLTPIDPDSHARWLRILKAHESLAALNDRNHREFDPLLQLLRKEVEALPAGRHPAE